MSAFQGSLFGFRDICKMYNLSGHLWWDWIVLMAPSRRLRTIHLDLSVLVQKIRHS